MSDKVTTPIRIVPMLGEEYRRPPLPKHPPNGLAYSNGPLVSSVQVYTLFWGAAWQGPLSALAVQVNQFFQYIVASPLIDQLSEYSVPGYPIQHGAFAGAKTVGAPPPPSSVSDGEIQTFVMQNQMVAMQDASHPPIDNRLYFVLLPNGVTVTMGGGASCGAPPNGFCGYHSAIASGPLYAVIPYPACPGCGGSFTTIDAITMFSSHELCEAITDPLPPTGWYGQVSGQQGEVGDFCNQQPKSMGGYTVQKMWSNTALGCV